ncbi:MAG: 50S ribosomal protein L18e [Candidatus Aenigmatarchaeota archaeon]
MPKPTGPENPDMLRLIREMRKTKINLYVDIASHLYKSKRKKKAVNLSKIGRLGDKEVIVPGDVAGSGSLTKPVVVYAWRFSSQARQKIKDAGGSALPLSELIKENKKARIII